MNGFLLIDKPKDWTSRDVCNKISRIFQTKKVGHIGTLDPFATGLLIIALGEATKAIPYLENLDKTYLAELILGNKTNTGDMTGKVIETKAVPKLDDIFIKETLNSFLGESMQIPPMTSAIKVNGKKLYELAHKGIEIERKERKIYIYNIDSINHNLNSITFLSRVSKGTYIRTLGEDIANKLGTVGHLSNLRRIQVGVFNVKDATTIDKCNNDSVISIKEILTKYMHVEIVRNSKILKLIENGCSIKFNLNEKYDKILLVNEKDQPLAIYSLNDEQYVCQRGFVK